MVDRHTKFGDQIMKVSALLFERHPTPQDIGADNLISGEANDESEQEFARGTLLWLKRNGVVTGNLDEQTPRAALFGAQLSMSAFSALDKVDGNVGVKLGEAAILACSNPPGLRPTLVAERIVAKLSGR